MSRDELGALPDGLELDASLGAHEQGFSHHSSAFLDPRDARRILEHVGKVLRHVLPTAGRVAEPDPLQLGQHRSGPLYVVRSASGLTEDVVELPPELGCGVLGRRLLPSRGRQGPLRGRPLRRRCERARCRRRSQRAHRGDPRVDEVGGRSTHTHLLEAHAGEGALLLAGPQLPQAARGDVAPMQEDQAARDCPDTRPGGRNAERGPRGRLQPAEHELETAIYPRPGAQPVRIDEVQRIV
jgi:hypothetical protein